MQSFIIIMTATEFYYQPLSYKKDLLIKVAGNQHNVHYITYWLLKILSDNKNRCQAWSIY